MLSSGFGGAERYFVDLGNALAKRGHDIQVICHDNFSGLDKFDRSEITEIRTFTVLGWWDVYHGFLVRNAIRKFRPEIVHAHLARGAYIAGKGCRTLAAPVVAKTHNYVQLKYYRNVNHFIATTEEQKSYLLESGIQEEQVSVIPNFSSMATESIDEQPYGKRRLVQFAACGRLVEKKGMHILLQAFRKFLDTGLTAELHIGGDGPEANHLRALSGRLGLDEQVYFHGWVDNVDTFISRYDCMILPSLIEPFGIVVLEAMAKGKPLIATSTDGPARILDQECAYMIRPGDVQELCNAMCNIVRHPGEGLKKAQAAQLLFKNTYSEEQVVPQLVSTYEKIIHARR